MHTLKALLILAFLYSSDSFSQGRGKKKGNKVVFECTDVLDCFKMNLCQARFALSSFHARMKGQNKPLGCKCQKNRCESEDSCEKDNV